MWLPILCLVFLIALVALAQYARRFDTPDPNESSEEKRAREQQDSAW